MYNDNEILIGLKAGDYSVFDFLYSKYRDKVIEFVVKNNGSETEADDVLQDSIVNVYKRLKISDIIIDKNFDVYFTTVYRNNWRTIAKIKSKRTFTDEFPEDLIFEEIDLYKEYQYVQIQNLIVIKFKELNSDCQKIIEQYYQQKKSLNEITYLMEYENVQIARNKKHRCLEYLRELIKNHINFKKLNYE